MPKRIQWYSTQPKRTQFWSKRTHFFGHTQSQGRIQTGGGGGGTGARAPPAVTPSMGIYRALSTIIDSQQLSTLSYILPRL